jgi:hypothetical protein
MVVLGVVLLGAAPAASAARDPAHITIAVMPGGTSVGELARVPGMGVAVLSAGIGEVSADQTYLDVGQGARVQESLYDRPLPPLRLERSAASAGGEIRVPVRNWRHIRQRADSTPADVTPGLLGAVLLRAGSLTGATLHRLGSPLMLVNGRGEIPPRAAGCRRRGLSPRTRRMSRCPAVTIQPSNVSRIRFIVRNLSGDDLLVALGEPPPSSNHGVVLGIAGRGFDGTLTSDSTRMRGFVLSTDIAPTILDRLGIGVPDEMTGESITTDGAVDASYVQGLSDRLAVIGPRRAPVIGVSVLGWLVLTALAFAGFRRAGLEIALTVLATSMALVPAVLLLCAAIEPSELAERLIVGIGCPVLAVAILWLAPGFRGLAIAAALSVGAYGVDVVAGSHLTELSLIGPNPIAGVRFYGIGNELEATIAALVPIGTGAALSAWVPRAGSRAAAAAFAIAAIVAILVFAPGRFGADVGAAVGLSIGGAVAVGMSLGARRWRWALVIAAPIAALAALVLIDLVSGGNAHLTRSVLDAGGLGDAGQVLQRRLELSAHSFARYAGSPIFWIVIALILVALARWRSIRTWFGMRDALWAGFCGAVAATVAGTLANDSGALLLMIGAVLCLATVGVAWATHSDRRNPGLWSPAGSVT